MQTVAQSNEALGIRGNRAGVERITDGRYVTDVEVSEVPTLTSCCDEGLLTSTTVAADLREQPGAASCSTAAQTEQISLGSESQHEHLLQRLNVR